MRAAAILLISNLLFLSEGLSVCSQPQPRLVCAEYFASDLVVEGSLVRTQPVYDKRERSYRVANIYTVRVSHVFRGDNEENVSIYESNDSGRATFDWIPGTKYILFLFRPPNHKLWELDGCGNSGPLRTAKAVLSELNTIDLQSRYGTIHGVVSRGYLTYRLSGVRVQARGGMDRYPAKTDKNGEFQIRVPVGDYAIIPVDASLAFEPFELSYSDPRHLQIQSGSCVQVQIMAHDKLP